MWTKGNYIPKDSIKDKDFILIRYDCSLCSERNEVELYGFFAEYFIRRPEYIWSTNIECPHCEAACYHDINIFYKKNHLILDVQAESVHANADWQTEINQESVYFSLIEMDNTHAIEIPFELDAIAHIIGNDSYSNYISSITELREILRIPHVNQEEVLLRIIYSNLITNFETYLFDLIINLINSDNNALRSVVEKYGIFEKAKIEKTNIFSEFESLKSSVIAELQKKSFHNLSTVVPLFKNGLSIDFSNKISGLQRAIEIRHDIVHRNGRDFNGILHQIKLSDVISLMLKTDKVVDFVNREFEKRNITILSTNL